MAPRSPVVTALCTLVLAALSIAGLWGIHIEPARAGIPVDFYATVLEKQKLTNGSPLKTEYTGVGPLDLWLSLLVASFLPGTAGWAPKFQLQQVYFFGQFFAICCVWYAEAYRGRNRGRLISFITPVAFLFQVVGGAFILPIYVALFISASARPEYFTASGRQVDPVHARALLPAIVMGYLVPTVIMYFPWSDIVTYQNLAAFWQFSPFFPSLFIPLFSMFGSPASSPATRTIADVVHLKRLYLAAGAVCAATHVGVLYVCLSSTNLDIAPATVLIPSQTTWKRDAAHGLLWIFQVDFWICAAASTFWCGLNVADIWRVTGRRATPVRVLTVMTGIGLLAVCGGPGAAMAAVWYWREDKMVELEKGEGGRVKTL